MLEKLKYPIGKVKITKDITKDDIDNWISIIEKHPNKLSKLVLTLDNNQLDTQYRPEGWTIRQVIHHLSDSHHNSYTRFKWTLTEDKPIIKVYYEERWAELFDSKTAPINLSLNNLTALHAKWVFLLKGLSFKELDKVFIHPDGNEEVTLKENIGIYAWHCEHHYEHINQLLIRKNWKK
ncbi:MAG: putative metal-dependent hydrolase [Flavobacteriaceae bacterium]|nr:putative metal-dependent hydrolase [Flavobacteriaceae bacterium]